MAVEYKTTILGTNSSASTSAAVNLSTLAAGDLVFVLVSRNNTSTPTTSPSGWTVLEEHASTYDHTLLYKVLGSGDLTTHTWSGFTSGKTRARAYAYTGAHATSPIAADTKGTFGTGSAQTLNLGSVNTSAPFIAVFASCYATSSKTFDLSSESLTERDDSGHTSPDFWQYGGDKTHAGGSFAPSTSTTFISASSTYRGGFIVAINQAVTALTPGAAPASASAPPATLGKQAGATALTPGAAPASASGRELPTRLYYRVMGASATAEATAAATLAYRRSLNGTASAEAGAAGTLSKVGTTQALSPSPASSEATASGTLLRRVPVSGLASAGASSSASLRRVVFPVASGLVAEFVGRACEDGHAPRQQQRPDEYVG
jgi:hypothetical protein